jgi:hypothetical protein
MSGCVYMYHINRIIQCMTSGTYNGTVDFDYNGVINFSDLLIALNIFGSC